MNWNKVAEVDKYAIYRDGIKIVETENTVFKDISLAPNKSYNYQVMSIIGENSSPLSQDLSITTLSDSTIISQNGDKVSNGLYIEYCDDGLENAFNAFALAVAEETGLNPNDPNVLAISHAMAARKEQSLNYYDLFKKTPYKTEVLQNLFFQNALYSPQEILNSGKTNFVGARFSGYFFVEEDGEYTFDLDVDDVFMMHVNGAEYFIWEFLPGKASKSIRLKKGLNYFYIGYYKFEFFNGHYNITIKKKKEGIPAKLEGFRFWQIDLPQEQLDELIAEKRDSDFDGLTDNEEDSLGTNKFNKDSDRDGLDDYVELNKYNTNPNNSDSDGDGVSDFNEITKSKTDPLEFDLNSSGFVQAFYLKGNQFNNPVGKWDKTLKSVICKEFAGGSINYNFSIAAANVYKIKVDVQNSRPNKLQSELIFYLDNVEVHR